MDLMASMTLSLRCVCISKQPVPVEMPEEIAGLFTKYAKPADQGLFVTAAVPQDPSEEQDSARSSLP
jgi:hypothetical protein